MKRKKKKRNVPGARDATRLEPLFSAALLSQLLRLLLLLLLLVLVVRVWCGYGVMVVCGDDTGAQTTVTPSFGSRRLRALENL